MSIAIQKYYRVLVHTFSMSQQQAVEYRVDYILRLIRAFIEVGVIIIVIFTFYSHTTTIAGWSKWEAIMVMGFFQLITATMYIFFGYGINDLPRNIINGHLDQFLSKPLDAQFLTSVKVTFMTNVFRAVFGLLVVIYATAQLHNQVTMVGVILACIAGLSAMVIFYSLSFLASAMAFWTLSYEQIELVSTLNSASRFPTSFFHPSLQKMMYIIPLAFISSVPTLALTGRDYAAAAASPLVAVTLFILLRKVWQAGLRMYQSASS